MPRGRHANVDDLRFSNARVDQGADHTIHTVVGDEVVSALAGRVVLAHLVAGQSTPYTIACPQEAEPAF